MHIKVYEKPERPFFCLSVCLSRQSTAPAAFGGVFLLSTLRADE